MEPIAENEKDPEDLQERAERLSERFPAVSFERVLEVLRKNGGHAGYAAADLRALDTDVIKPVDPEDAEHVATLLSNKTLFKQTCRAHFRKFDLNQNGTLEWDEVLALTNHLCSYMGLERPGEKSLKAFFEASDTNHDGVLTDREFPKFFEAFLRYAFFMQHRRLVGTWRYRADPNESLNSEFSIQLGKDYRLYWRSVRGTCPGAPQSQVLQGRQEMNGILELREGFLQADLKVCSRDGRDSEKRSSEVFFGVVRLRFAEGTTEKVLANFKSDPQAASWGNDVTAKRRQTIEEEKVSRCTTPAVGAILRCNAEHGVSYRRSPEYPERTDNVLAQGDTVRVLERHLDTPWVRVSCGWLPVVDQRGVPLLEIEADLD
jgi:hypothetical protein